MGPAIGLICLSFVGCDKTQAIIWLCLSVSLNGAVNSGFQVNHVEMSPNYAGTLFGITNMLANLTGFITPAVAGNITNFNVSKKVFDEKCIFKRLILLFLANFRSLEDSFSDFFCIVCFWKCCFCHLHQH